jgi:hypothetical protein
MSPTPLKAPYLRKDQQIGAHQVWIVDGSYVRGHLDEEFTNFGQHYRYSYIPLDEFWIDQEARDDERHFFIDHLLVERRLMAAGKPYNEALTEADRVERRERRRAGDVRRLTDNGAKLPQGKDVHEELWKKLENGVSVWIVNGRLVRSVFDVDFTAGGHDHVYEFVPHDEVWIDNDIEEYERPYVLLHELHERNLMAAGKPYSQAHADSSRLEYNCRRHPDGLHDALAAEGWA